MNKDKIVYAYILEYMRKIRQPRSGKLGDLENQLRKDNFPISEPETADLLDIICRLKQPKRILEIGTCAGFSALLMNAAASNAEIDTIERNPVMIELAKHNFLDFKTEKINLIEGNALDILPRLQAYYDFIFIDAAKGQYPSFFEESKRLLSNGGVLIADNIFFNGYVASGVPDVRRNKTIVTRLNTFLYNLENDSNLKTVLLPISDGVSLSYKL